MCNRYQTIHTISEQKMCYNLQSRLCVSFVSDPMSSVLTLARLRDT